MNYYFIYYRPELITSLCTLPALILLSIQKEVNLNILISIWLSLWLFLFLLIKHNNKKFSGLQFLQAHKQLCDGKLNKARYFLTIASKSFPKIRTQVMQLYNSPHLLTKEYYLQLFNIAFNKNITLSEAFPDNAKNN